MDTFPCLMSPDCQWRGPWADALTHAQSHTLSHPDDREAWLRARRASIGASEMPSVAGLSPWRSALDVWNEKVNGPGDRAMPSRARMGLVLEPALLGDYAARHGVQLERPASRRHPDLRFITATPDALVKGTDEGVQCKVVGHNSAHKWSDGPPAYVLAQVQTEMAVFGLARVIVLAMIDSDEPQEWPVDRDPETWGFLAELAERFWQGSVVPRTLPEDFDKATAEEIARLYPRALRPLRKATAEEIAMACDYSDASHVVKEAEGRKAEAKARCLAAIGEAEGFEWAVGRATWKAPKGSPAWKAIAEEMAERFVPADEAKHIIAQHTPALGSRTFNVRIKGDA